MSHTPNSVVPTGSVKENLNLTVKGGECVLGEREGSDSSVRLITKNRNRLKIVKKSLQLMLMNIEPNIEKLDHLTEVIFYSSIKNHFNINK